jgi:hypothetical protein
MFEEGVPARDRIAAYEALLSREADQIDLMVAGAYSAMRHFELFAAQSMLYFATVSYAEVSQRLAGEATDAVWSGFLGVGDPVLEPLPRQSYEQLESLDASSAEQRSAFANWIAESIAPRNVAGLADPRRRNLYPVDLDALIEAHALLGRTRDQLLAALPALRGQSPEPSFAARGGDRSISRPGPPLREQGAPAPR